ncbi:hypothetical protein ACGFI9_37395 [Micromonospora sp. NPDC048930]|uniref:hypothetical protein n=1 Tax=Micromonospora sp. NPDC048930 TaxID=3364261 RepID=UPI00371F8373
MIRTAAQILADIRTQDGDDEQAATPRPVDVPRRRRGVVDLDAGIGRLLVGYDNIHRHAQVWIGEAPPEEPLPARPSPLRQGCPSEGQYRRHLQAGEKCTACREHVHQLEKKRRARRGGW